MFGHRPDGRRVKKMDPIVRFTPYLMPMRCDAQVFLDQDVDYDPLVRYIAKKSREGIKITFMEIIIAAFVRAISQSPECNRFVMNNQLYDRKELTVSFVVLVENAQGEQEESIAKVFFDPNDTIFDVSTRVKHAIEQNRNTEENGNVLNALAAFLMSVPLLPNLVVGLVKLLDRYGLLPKFLMDILPFYSSLFVTNMASIGMDRVYHHIYNFGNTSLFFSLGNVKRSYGVNSKGEVIRNRSMPVGITADERICGGAVYGKMFAIFKNALKDPSILETPVDAVNFSPNCEYHVKPLSM